MKTTVTLVFTLVMFAWTGQIFGQIYIDTGNPNIEQYKKNNPEAEVWESDKKPEETTTPTPPSKPATTTTTTTTTTTPVTTKTTTTKTVTPTPISKKIVVDETLIPAKDELPEYAEPGKCYARCYIPDRFRFEESKVIDKPKSYKTQVIPAVYETIYDTVTIRPESIKKKVVPAKYEYVEEKIMIAPSTTKWVKGKADENCLSNDPNDCQVLCLVEVPAKYKTQKRKVLETPSYTYDVVTPAEYKIVPKKVLKTPAKTMSIEVPATYKTVMNKVVDKKGGYQEWREVLCGDDLTSDRIRQIQLALKAKGYDPGPIDNIFGSQTKAALVKYQEDNSLPMGNLNMETLNSLGVK